MYQITDIQIVPIAPKNGLVGFASVVFNDAFYLGSIGIMCRPQGGYRLAYPTRVMNGGGSFNVYRPINSTVADLIESMVIKRFEEVTKLR